MPSRHHRRSPSRSGGARDESPRPRLSPWKKALFSTFVLIGVFGLLEVVLFLAGTQPLLFEEDPYVGFASQVPLYVEQDGQAGRMVTARNKLRFFNRQEFAKRKESGVTRVFCLGGSTTYGRPYDDATSFCGWLRELLPVADPSRDWELINAGGISYASYRVAALMEELSAFEPDLFIVYCGQNEFLERRTYSGIIDMPKPVRGLAAVLSRTRTYSATARVLRGRRGEPKSTGGSAGRLSGEVDAILDQSVGLEAYRRDQDLERQVIAHYRYNMARIADIARASGADVLFVTPASNLRDCSPFKSQHRDGLDTAQMQEWEARWQKAKDAVATKQFADALDALDRAAEIDGQFAELHYLRGRVLDGLGRFGEAKTAYQRALDEDVCPLRALSPMRDIVVEVARDRGVPVVDFARMVEEESPQGIPGADHFLDHVHPTIDGHRMLALTIVDELARQDILRLDPGWNDAAGERVAARIMGRVDPKAQGVAMRNLSKVYSWAGKMEDAYRAARKALELYPGDAETHYQVGNLARRLGKTDEALERLRYLVGVDLDAGVRFYLKAHTQLAAILAERGEYADSEQVVRKLLRLAPGNADGTRQLIDVLTLQGRELIRTSRPAEAARKLAEVSRLQPDDFESKVQLGVALVRAGDHEAAVPVLNGMIRARPDYLPAYDNLSFVLAQLGRLDEAEDACRRALQVDPDHEAAQRNLQLILRKKTEGG